MNVVRIAFAAAVVAMVTGGISTAAHAVPPENRVPVGAGSGIHLSPGMACTMAAVGYDRTGRLIGLTAADCVDPKMPLETQVSADLAPGLGSVGKVVAGSRELDYAVVALDPTKVNPVRMLAGDRQISGVAPFPGQLSQVCGFGAVTGYDCSIVLGAYQGYMFTQTCTALGDIGGPILADGHVVGMIQHDYTSPGLGITLPVCRAAANMVHAPTVAMPMDRILNDINAHALPGAGFQPM